MWNKQLYDRGSMQIVVISKDQARWLRPMSEALHKSFPSVPRIFVIDRCIDDSKNILESIEDPFIENTEGTGFLAGKMRDIGLNYYKNLDDTLFLDGDRIPVNLDEKLCLKALESFDILLIRIYNEGIRPFHHRLKPNAMWGQIDNCVFTAGILIKGKVIVAIREIQNGRLFHENFDGTFGDEDRYFGDVAFNLGFSCGMFGHDTYLLGETFHSVDSETYANRLKFRLKMREKLKEQSYVVSSPS